ncbi:MAG: PQQ-binding-like beta-propeller repeat protein [Acidimicrobiales bacterium]
MATRSLSGIRRSARRRRWSGLAGLAALGVLAASCGGQVKHSSPATTAAFPTSTGPAPTTTPAYPSYAPWPEAGHDPRRSGASSVKGPQTGKVRWIRNLGAPITAGPVVGPGGVIVVATDSGVLQALDPATGADRWTFNGGTAYGANDLSTSPAILPDGTIVWPGPSNTLFGISPAGKKRWTLSFPAMLLSPVVASPTKVYVSDTSGDLSSVQVGPSTAKVLWSLALGGGTGSSFGSPALGHGGTIYTTDKRQAIAVVDHGAKGTVLWRYTVGADIEVSPAVAADGTVVVGTNDPYQYGLSPTGALRWKVRRVSETYSSTAATADGLTYYGDNNGIVYVTQSSTGKPVVRYQGLEGVWSTPVVDSAHDAYFGTQGKHIYGYAYDGRKLFDIDAHAPIDSYPALGGDGALIIGTEKANLYSIGS